jgi:hypothetical protein
LDSWQADAAAPDGGKRPKGRFPSLATARWRGSGEVSLMEEERFSGTAVWVFSVVDRYIDDPVESLRAISD